MVEDLLPLVRKVADTAARRFACPALDFAELYQIGALALSEAAENWEPAESYPDQRGEEAHLWLYARPRVFGAMVDAVRKERRSRLRRPVEFVPLDEQPEAEEQRVPADPTDTIEFVARLYNRLGERDTEIAVGYAINETPQYVLAEQFGVCPSEISRQWSEITKKIKKMMTEKN